MTVGGVGTIGGMREHWFGRLFRALGFRWVFPIGTLPIPYHPLLAIALLAAVPVWLVAGLALGPEGSVSRDAWLQMLIVGLVLGVPMSIPIVSWMAMVFRVPLIQSLLFAAAMILLAAEVARGRAEPGLAALPAGYLGLWLFQRIGGLVRVRQLRRESEAFEPVVAGQRTVWPIEGSFPDCAKLLAGGYAVRCRPPQQHGKVLMHRLAEADARALLTLGPAMPLPGWSLEEKDGFWLLQRPAALAKDEVLVERRAYRDPLGRVTGELSLLRIHDGEGWRERIAGVPQIVGPLPLATLFHWTAIFGGKSQWMAGFVRRAAAPIGGKVAEHDSWPLLLARAAEPAFERDQLDAIMAAAREGLAADPAAIECFWRSMAEETGWPTGDARFAVFRDLKRRPALLGHPELVRTLDWLERARDARNKQGVSGAAALLAGFDEAVLRLESERLRRIFNSRVLGMAWKLTPDFDPAPLPNPTPRFGDQGGYGLITTNAPLYEKLARLSPDFEDLVKGLAEEALKYDWKLSKPLRDLAERPSATE
jgi:hypothetical protein